jgi:hypothetical protein
LVVRRQTGGRRRMKWLGVALLALCLISCDSASEVKSPGKGVTDGRVEWVDPKTIQPGPIRRDALSAEQMDRLRALQATFAEVDSMPFEKWVEDFKRDTDPDREIRIYEAMAEVYLAYCGNRALTLQAKQDVYRVVLLRSGVPEAEVLGHVKLKALSIDDAKEVLKLYTAPPSPITMSTVPVAP